MVKTAIGDLINALLVPTKGSVKIGRFTNNGINRIKNIDKLRFDTGYVYKKIHMICSLIIQLKKK
ncbi:MAG: hypothetical protein L6V81_04390 [Clostridium sp.]|nr:MAG: hypothetical protein L6V81_04390 [Clostridium sp.]